MSFLSWEGKVPTPGQAALAVHPWVLEGDFPATVAWPLLLL